jgi:hypothetical protein
MRITREDKLWFFLGLVAAYLAILLVWLLLTARTRTPA